MSGDTTGTVARRPRRRVTLLHRGRHRPLPAHLLRDLAQNSRDVARFSDGRDGRAAPHTRKVPQMSRPARNMWLGAPGASLSASSRRYAATASPHAIRRHRRLFRAAEPCRPQVSRATSHPHTMSSSHLRRLSDPLTDRRLRLRSTSFIAVEAV